MPRLKWNVLGAALFATGCGSQAPEVKLETPESSAAVAKADSSQAKSTSTASDEGNSQANEEPIRLSPAAAARVRELMAKDPQKDKLRISLVEKFGGDVRWSINLTSKVDALDDTMYSSQGLTIVVDKASQKLILGTKVDCVERNGKKSFVFDSPRLKTLR